MLLRAIIFASLLAPLQLQADDEPFPDLLLRPDNKQVIEPGKPKPSEDKTQKQAEQNQPQIQQSGKGTADSKGAINPATGQTFPKSGSGVINPQTGQTYPKSGRGYINPQTGEYYPAK